MARTPTRLAGPALVDATAETIYTVPGSTIAVIKNVTLNNPNGDPATVTLSIGAEATGTRVFTVEVPLNGFTNQFFYIPMAAAEVIQASSSDDDEVIITIGGDEYDA